MWVRRSTARWRTDNLEASPTAVTIGTLSASAQGDRILVSWQTFDEFEMLGFQLSRSTDPLALEADRQLLFETQASFWGQNRGDSYSFSDADVQSGVSYTYWLKVVLKNGSTKTLDPYTASLLEGRSGSTSRACCAERTALASPGGCVRRYYRTTHPLAKFLRKLEKMNGE